MNLTPKRLIVVVLFLALPTALRAEEGHPASEHRITFLHLYKVGSSITLDSVTTAPGTLKVPKQLTVRPGDLRVSVQSDAGVELFQTSLADPAVLRLEYADSAGTLQTKVEVRDSVHFTLRLPYNSENHQVSFRRVEEINADRSARRVESPLGTIVLPRAEPDHD